MHYALQLPEVFDLICTFIDRRTLVHLLHTCHMFEECSRRLLWMRLDSLYPLMFLLPDSVLKQASARYSGTTTRLPELSTSLSDNEWQRIRLYTSCVIDLRIEPSQRAGSHTIHGHELEVLAALKLPEALAPMFPKLRTIRSGNPKSLTRNNSIISFLDWLDRQAVNELELVLDKNTWPITDAPFLDSVSDFFPNATKVTIHTDHLMNFPRVSKAICNWNHLVHASFLALSIRPAAYKHLSQLKALTSLQLRGGGDYGIKLADTLAEEHPGSCFSSLTDLLLDVSTSSRLSFWIRHYHLALTSLTCRVDQDLDEPHELLPSIVSQIDHASLQTISLSSPRDYIDGSKKPHTCSIQPLFAFANLREISISGMWLFSMDDDELGDIACSWPLLEVLDLHRCNMAYLESTRPMATFRGLFSLVKNCPRLRELSMMIDASDNAWIDLGQTAGRVSNDTLSKLVIIHSPITYAKRVALIIKATFPSLKQVDLGDWESMMPYLGGKMGRGEIPTARISLWHRVNSHLMKWNDSAEMTPARRGRGQR